MRILHLSSLYSPFSYGGCERVVEVLAENQAKLGHEVAVSSVVPERQSSGERNGVQTLPLSSRNPLWIEGSAGFPSPVRMLNKVCTFFNVFSARDFGRIIEQYRPDIVHTHSLVELPPMVWNVAKKRKVAIVHTLHDYDLLCIRAALFRNGKLCAKRDLSCVVASGWKKLFHSKIDAVVAISRPVLETHIGYGLFSSLPKSRKRIIWNPVPLADEIPARRKETSGDLVFGFIGRVTEEKGMDIILDACRRLPTQGWKLKVAGTIGSSQKKWVEASTDLPIEWLGRQPATEFYNQIDVLLAVPVWKEPFGLTVVEAFGAGVPVVGSRIGAVEELVGRISEDWLVPAADPDALAEKMIQVMSQGRNSLPLPQAFKPVLDEVRPDRIVAAYGDVYDTVANAI